MSRLPSARMWFDLQTAQGALNASKKSLDLKEQKYKLDEHHHNDYDIALTETQINLIEFKNPGSIKYTPLSMWSGEDCTLITCRFRTSKQEVKVFCCVEDNEFYTNKIARVEEIVENVTYTTPDLSGLSESEAIHCMGIISCFDIDADETVFDIVAEGEYTLGIPTTRDDVENIMLQIEIEKDKIDHKDPSVEAGFLDYLEECLESARTKSEVPVEKVRYRKESSQNFKCKVGFEEIFRIRCAKILEKGINLTKFIDMALSRGEKLVEIKSKLPIPKKGNLRIYSPDYKKSGQKLFTLKTLTPSELVKVCSKSIKIGKEPGDIHDINSYHKEIQIAFSTAKNPEHFCSLVSRLGQDAKKIKGFNFMYATLDESEKSQILDLCSVEAANLIDARLKKSNR
jgi:hypothetical protein